MASLIGVHWQEAKNSPLNPFLHQDCLFAIGREKTETPLSPLSVNPSGTQ